MKPDSLTREVTSHFVTTYLGHVRLHNINHMPLIKGLMSNPAGGRTAPGMSGGPKAHRTESIITRRIETSHSFITSEGFGRRLDQSNKIRQLNYCS